ncbi:mechanosensitive ion channel family protein [Salegentibacter maritimus]|uniref:mechanosensitive ion channel family protein n=1 Tax=Salegentibacter maritimus TaxID=2794347 RepID=UPI0018E43B05|nr:mechanosensitive ion channel family protein [Salegentibacter maritimus]MBI6116253.1 mechanosensitive ion channel family protein [Salegentibacter maritimus]
MKKLKCLSVFCICLWAGALFAQDVSNDSLLNAASVADTLKKKRTGFPVYLKEDSLFVVFEALGPYTARERAQRSTNLINELFQGEEVDSTLFYLQENSGLIILKYKDLSLASVTPQDAVFLKDSQENLAQRYLTSIIEVGLSYHKKEVWYKKWIRIGLLVLTLVVFVFLIKFLNRGINFLIHKSLDRESGYLKGIKIKDYEFISVNKERWLIMQALKVLKWIIIIFLFSLALPLLFSIFPATEPLSNTIFSHIVNPLKNFGNAILKYIPNLFTIFIIVLIARFVTKFLYFLSTEVEKEKLKLPGFYSDWARPTFNLLRVIVWAFAFITIFPYLPGSDSAVFQGVSVFLGLLISLGSSTAIGNIIAGLVITYMRAFKIGDRVKIGETVGDVIEKTMLVTKVRTVKNEEVAIPNAAILTGSTINYTANAGKLGLVLHSKVTIGYDVPWRKVHELLIEAASQVESVNKEPRPFVLQTALDDFSVSYEINAYTNNPRKSQQILSNLHENIQDAFNEANIEILSPIYSSIRDGDHPILKRKD